MKKRKKSGARSARARAARKTTERVPVNALGDADYRGCATREEFNAWLAEARFVAGKDVTFCTDCTPEFQAASMAARLCERPYVKFFRSAEDGELYGALAPRLGVRLVSLDVPVRASSEPWLPALVSNAIAFELGMR